MEKPKFMIRMVNCVRFSIVTKEKKLVNVDYNMTPENYILTDIWKKVIEMDVV